MLPQVLYDFRMRHEQVEIECESGNTADIVRNVENGLLDVGFVEGEVHNLAVEVTPLAKEALVIVTSDKTLAQSGPRAIEDLLDRPMRFMEVCGTHTVSIFRGGLRSLLPATVTHLTGPGCPVCVTHDREVAAFLRLAEEPGVIIATFGDLMRVPGPDGRSLKHAQAEGARVSVVYSPLDALTLAADNPDATVVFLGVGFETTAQPWPPRFLRRKRAASIISRSSPATSWCLRHSPPCLPTPTTPSTPFFCRATSPRYSASNPSLRGRRLAAARRGRGLRARRHP